MLLAYWGRWNYRYLYNCRYGGGIFWRMAVFSLRAHDKVSWSIGYGYTRGNISTKTKYFYRLKKSDMKAYWSLHNIMFLFHSTIGI